MEVHPDIPCRWIGWKSILPIDVQAEEVGKVIRLLQVTSRGPMDHAEHHRENDAEVGYFEETFKNHADAATLLLRECERGDEDEESDSQLFGVDRTEESGQHRFAPGMPEEDQLHSSDFQPVDPRLPGLPILSA